ncbi:MAG: DUF2142 domain-containing protein [Methanobrevibacter sp.]|jgi:uncharacterized membrane protein|nr:DUF2142 domain-containing protein [Candidatus Methanovirga basalitermitum]
MLNNKNNLIKTETIFLFLSLTFGLIFAIVTPQFGVFDGSAHFVKSYDVSNGHIIPQNVDVVVPDEYETHVYGDFIDTNGDYVVNMSHQSIFSYPPLPYLANAFVIKIGEFFNFPPITLIFICKIVNLLIYILIVYFAIKIIPILKTTLLLIALMPTTLFIASSVSGDSLIFALSFLVIALFIKLALIKDKMQLKYVYMAIISSLALSMTKPSYSLLSLLFFIVPYNKFQSIKHWIITLLGSSLIPLFISMIWNTLFKYLYPYLEYSFNSYLQTHTYNITYLASNPIKFLDLLINTIIYNDGYIINIILPQFVSDIGSGTQIPIFLTYIYLIVLVFVSLYDVCGFKLNLKQKLISISVFLIIFLSISVAELITWTPIDSNVIWGLQGRYFIPTAPLLLLIFNNSSLKSSKLEKIREKFNLNVILVLYIVIFLSLSIFFILTNQRF